jgi:hypothetical protein
MVFLLVLCVLLLAVIGPVANHSAFDLFHRQRARRRSRSDARQGARPVR